MTQTQTGTQVQQRPVEKVFIITCQLASGESMELYPRSRFDPERVDLFAELLSDDPLGLPPIEVVRSPSGKVFGLVDGKHRLEAHRKLGLPEIAGVVVSVPAGMDVPQFMYERSLQRCTESSLPLTTKEKIVALRRLLAISPEMSSHRIGKLLGLSHTTIDKYRKGGVKESPPGEQARNTTTSRALQVARSLDALAKKCANDQEIVKLLSEAFDNDPESNAQSWWCWLAALVALSGQTKPALDDVDKLRE